MKVTLPELGEGIDSAKVVEIHVSEGDMVKEEDDLIEVETDKAVAGVPSTAAGKVAKIHVSEGDEVSTGDVLVEIEEEGGSGQSDEDESGKKEDRKEDGEPEDSEEESASPAGTEQDSDEGEGDASAKEEKKPSSKGKETDPQDSGNAGDRTVPPAGPELRELARELGIDLQRVRGSGRGGRITMDDLRGYISRIQREAFAEQPAGPDFEDLSSYGPIHSEDLPSIRKTISRRLLERWRQTPLVTQFGEARLDHILEAKKKLGKEAADQDINLTLSAFFLQVLSRLLKKYPKFNAAIDLEAGKVIYRDYVHIGVAVATDQGLLVPVVRDADKRDLLDLAKQLENLSGKARDGKLSPEDMAGASFYLSNQGAIGGGHFTPLLSGTESAILGVGKGSRKVVPDDGQQTTAVVVPLSLSYDHRLLDGAEAANFMEALIGKLENFEEMDDDPDSGGKKGGEES